APGHGGRSRHPPRPPQVPVGHREGDGRADPAVTAPSASSPITSLITGFVGELRAAGVPVSMVETIDAMRALEVIDIGDRSGLKSTLAATLVKSERHLAAFDTAFEVFFATAPHRGEERPDGVGPSAKGEAGASGGMGEEDLD